jgi:peroxiredoxin
MKKFILIVSTIFIVNCAFSQETDYALFGIKTAGVAVPSGLKDGDRSPSFSGYDQTGKFTESAKLLQKGPMVLFFYRGNWCPICNKTLKNYEDSLKIITDQGFSVVAITPESIENVETTVKMNNISYTVIYDCQEKIMSDFGVMFNVTEQYQNKLKEKNIDLVKINGRPEAHLPVPATYIINRDGIIVAAWFDPDYRHRAPVTWIIRNLGRAL